MTIPRRLWRHRDEHQVAAEVRASAAAGGGVGGAGAVGVRRRDDVECAPVEHAAKHEQTEAAVEVHRRPDEQGNSEQYDRDRQGGALRHRKCVIWFEDRLSDDGLEGFGEALARKTVTTLTYMVGDEAKAVASIFAL